MPAKPHIKLNLSVQKEPTIGMSFNHGFGSNGEDTQEEPNYQPMVETFRSSLAQLRTDIEMRAEERDEELRIPAHIDYLQILFQGQFNVTDYYQRWYNDFGLQGVHFSQFNREVLFAVVDLHKFTTFQRSIENFIRRESDENRQVMYQKKVKFVRDFKLLTTQDILNFQEPAQLMNFQLTEFPAGSSEATTIRSHLQQYLEERRYQYRIIEETSTLEVYGAPLDSIEEIARNFDVLLSITSSLSTVVRPSEFNAVERSYGFTISNAKEDLPIIGILDTGISNDTPLRSIILDDESFNLTTSSPFIDNASDGLGHGTSVAALATLGRRPYSVDYRGDLEADAKLLSMKILDLNSGYLSSAAVLDMLNEAKKKYPDLKLFVLTTCYSSHKATNENFSAYTYRLDKFAHENDCLIFICTANNNSSTDKCSGYDLNYFNEEETNISSPADSMNNVVVGAAADNLKNGTFVGISSGREFPTLYTRKGHIDLEEYKKSNKRFTKNNVHLFKPDVIECGGDYEQVHGFIGSGEDATLEVLSADPTRSFIQATGTSYSAPLVANIAARIQKNYPSLRAQTIKALIINGASLDAIRFDESVAKLRNRTAGHGIVSPERSVNSTDNAITFVIEDEIIPEQMKVVPLNFPKYLTQDDLGKKQGILQITATLCFSFEPVFNNQLCYCPLQMAFAFFRNHSGDDILKSGNTEKGGINSVLKKSWSQNNRWKSSPIPASNSQKVQFLVGIKDLEDERSTFKLAVHCLVNSQLLTSDKYQAVHPFSMAITVEEKLPSARQTGNLYTEMTAINEVTSITDLEGEADVELEN